MPAIAPGETVCLDGADVVGPGVGPGAVIFENQLTTTWSVDCHIISMFLASISAPWVTTTRPVDGEVSVTTVRRESEVVVMVGRYEKVIVWVPYDTAVVADEKPEDGDGFPSMYE